jgi:EmrB/QacA subfamily drug resistance transporter
MCSAQLVLAIDVTAVNVANASIERALHFHEGNLQWIATAYSLTFGGFLLLGGRMADLYGRRRLFIIGISAFAITSIGAGTSQGSAQLIACRLAQGLCASIISPTLLSLLAVTFAEGRARQRAFGIWATAGAVGGLTGFLFGGFITSTLGWRWIFFINGPIAALAISGAVFALPKDKPHLGHRRRLDVPGALSVTAGLALVIFGLGEAQSTSWTATPTLVALCLAPALLVVFYVIEHRTPEPLLPFSLLRRRAAVGNVLAMFQQCIGGSTAFLAPLFMQNIWGFSAGRAGLATIPLPIGFGIGSRLSARLVGTIGMRRLVIVGFSLVSAGVLLLSRVPNHGNYYTAFMPALFLRSFGQGLVVVPIVTTVTSGVGREDQGIAAGLYNMGQQLGGAIGLAVIATVAAAATAHTGLAAAAEAHGLRVAFVVCLGLALAGLVIAISALRSDVPTRDASGEDLGIALEGIEP